MGLQRFVALTKSLLGVGGQVFIGSCMTNIGHFRAAGKLLAQFPGGQLPTRLWVAPPTKMDAAQLTAEGYYSIYGKASGPARTHACPPLPPDPSRA